MPEFNASLFNTATFGGGQAPPMCNLKAKEVLYIAFREARVLKRPQGGISPSEARDGMIFLSQQIDYWSAQGMLLVDNNIQQFTLTPNHQPTLIGPGLANT